MRQVRKQAQTWFAGIDPDAHCYTAYSADPETSRAYKAFMQDDSDHLKLLFSINMFNEVVHVPGISGVILFRPTVSPIIYKQQIGRALTTGTHDTPLILDVINNFGSLSSTWDYYFEVACAYRAQHGDLTVQRSYESESGFVWESKTDIARKNEFEHAQQFAEQFGNVPQTYMCKVGFCLGTLELWETRRARQWERYYDEAKVYYDQNGNLKVSYKLQTANGLNLGAWVCTQRSLWKKGNKQALMQRDIGCLSTLGCSQIKRRKVCRTDKRRDMKQKTVEILLASYNGEAYIREQIDSILNQTDGDWHLTVSDDGSSDKTPDILDDYVRRYPDKIVRICSGRKFGQARDHFMWLIGQCDAEYIATCDQDDYWFSDKIEKLRGIMQKIESEHGEATPILVFSDQTPTDAKLHPLCDSLMKMQKQYTDEIDWRALIFQNIVTGGACMFNRSLAQMAARCHDTDRIIMHDWWLAIVAARFGKVMYLDESTGYYRQHGHNSVGAKNVGSLLYILNKLMHPGLLRETIVNKKHQAEMFARTYGKELDKTDGMFLASFVRLWSGPLFYWNHRTLIHDFFLMAGMMVLG